MVIVAGGADAHGHGDGGATEHDEASDHGASEDEATDAPAERLRDVASTEGDADALVIVALVLGGMGLVAGGTALARTRS